MASLWHCEDSVGIGRQSVSSRIDVFLNSVKKKNVNSYAELGSKAKICTYHYFQNLNLKRMRVQRQLTNGVMLFSFLLMMSRLNFLDKQIKGYLVSANATDSCGIKKRKRKTQMNSPSFLCEDQCSEDFATATNPQTFWYNARWFTIDMLSPDVLAHRSKAFRNQNLKLAAVTQGSPAANLLRETVIFSIVIFNHTLSHSSSCYQLHSELKNPECGL